MNSLERPTGTGPSHQTSQPFQILSLSGGGYRGLFTAVILEELELRAGKPLRDCFDLIAGTSIGGILACGVAMGVPARDMRREFEIHGPSVFNRYLSIRGRRILKLPKPGVLRARYSRKGLVTTVDAVLGQFKTTTLGAVTKPLLVPAVSVTNANAVIFESGLGAGNMAGTALRDVAFATSAAPTYLPDHVIKQNSFVDGGIVANSPDVVAVMKAMGTWGRRPSELKLLSVGTAAEQNGEAFQGRRASGALSWMFARKIFDLTLAAQQELALNLVREFLGTRNLRIDARPDRARAKVTGLDVTGRKATAALVGLAQNAITDVDARAASELATMLRHHSSK